MSKAIEPVGESQSDYEAVVRGRQEAGHATRRSPTASPVDDLIKGTYDGHEASTQIVTWEEFQEKEYYVAARRPGLGEVAGRPVRVLQGSGEPTRCPRRPASSSSTPRAWRRHFPDDEERPPYPASGSRRASPTTSASRASGRRRIRCWSCPTTAAGASTPRATTSPGPREALTCKVKGCDGYLYEPCWINPQDAEAQGHQERRHRQGLQRARQRALRRPRLGADHARRASPSTTAPGPTSSAPRAARPRRRHQPHLARGPDLQARRRPGHQRLPGRGGEGHAWRRWRSGERSIPRPSQREYDPASGLRFNAWVEEGR